MENDELAQHLDSLQRESCYRVDAVLKSSPVETTQRVYFEGANGAETGPYIRKFMQRGAGIGGAYEQIFRAQNAGKRFKHIPDILECYTRSEELVVVMECVRGQTLQDAVYERDPSLSLAVEVFPRLCDAVSELHAEFDPPIIHRDLKPSNIMLVDGGLVLIDFGISREFREGAEADTTHFGTRDFAPPEQYGFQQTTVRSDVYSLGMVLYFCLTEKMPTAHEREAEFRDGRIPESVRRVIAQATSIDPANRFASAQELKLAFLDGVKRCASSAPSADGPAGSESEAPSGGRPSPDSDSEPFTAAQPANVPSGRKRRSSIASIVGIAAACLCAAIVALLVFLGGARSGSAPSGESQSATLSESADAPSSGAGTDTAQSSASTDEVSEQDVAKGIQITAAAKDGFDPATNVTIDVDRLRFQMPRYFTAYTDESDDGTYTYYYAERGSSVAMVMTGVTEIDAAATPEEVEEAKDAYVDGLLESGGGFDRVTASTDYTLAGRTARIATFQGSVLNVPMVAKAAFFYDPETSSIGAVMFAQTHNVQFDYSEDFAKMVTSAAVE